MEKKRYKKNKKLTRTQKIKNSKRKIRLIMISLTTAVFIFIGLSILRSNYLEYKCQNLTYAMDYYFTTNKSDTLRINYVQKIDFIQKDEHSVKVEAFGLSPTEPPERTTLVGSFSKNENGSWFLSEISKKK